MAPRSRIAWLPLLLGLYLVGIIAYIAVTRWTALASGHPAYPLTLLGVGLGAFLTIAAALLRGRRR